jgi:tRNA (guanine-N7-)-methyltransferase
MRIRQHVNPLKSDFFTIAPEAVVLPAGLPLEVELGSAEAWFLQGRSREDPAAFYLGVEIRRELVEKANDECVKQGWSQVRSVYANMSVDLPRLLGPLRVRRFFLNFPDPWWKRPQHKRRVLGSPLIDQLAGLLAPAGEIHVASDIFDHALDAMFLLESDPAHRFESLRAPWSFLGESPFAARSRRELQCEREGIKIWRLAYRLRPSS